MKLRRLDSMKDTKEVLLDQFFDLFFNKSVMEWHHIFELWQTPQKVTLNEDFTALLELSSQWLGIRSASQMANKNWLTEKSNFHITLIWSSTWEEIESLIAEHYPDRKAEFMAKIRELINKFSRQFTMLDEFYLIQKDYPWQKDDGEPVFELRKTIIQAALLPDLEQFYAELNVLFDNDFPVPFPHVTLYSTSTNPNKVWRWIGVYSREHLNDLHPIRI